MGCESISVFFMDNFDADIEAMRRAKGHSDILLTACPFSDNHWMESTVKSGSYRLVQSEGSVSK